jgi:4'-phosphopantetheinyl transferase
MNLYWLEQTDSDVPADNQWLSPKETTCLSAMRFAKRRTDWRLGRWTAKQTIAACLTLPAGLDALAAVEIHAAASGAPEVFFDGQPADVAISLSHRAGTALCTVATVGCTFGCDLEMVEPRSDAFVADYFTAMEQALIERASPQERPLLLALLWSAKESALKALRVGLRLDTRSVCVTLGDACLQSAGKMQASDAPSLPANNSDAWHPMSVGYSSSQLFAGWWRVQDNLVRTVVSDGSLRMPRHARNSSLASESDLNLLSRTTPCPA